MSASLNQPDPQQQRVPGSRKANGQVDRTIKKRRKAKAQRRAATAGTPIVGAPMPAPGLRAQPLPAHRMPKLAIGQPKQGAAALTNALIAYFANFAQDVSVSGYVPTQHDCTSWLGIAQACLNAVVPDPKAVPKAA